MKRFMFLIGAAAIMLSMSCMPETIKGVSTSTEVNGSWTVTNTMSGEQTFHKDNVIVDMEIPDNTKNLLDITFNGVKFVPGMPDIPMKVSNIEFVETKPEDPTKHHCFEQEGVIPTVEGVPYDNYKIKVIKGYIGVDTEIEMELETSPFKATFTTKKESVETPNE